MRRIIGDATSLSSRAPPSWSHHTLRQYRTRRLQSVGGYSHTLVPGILYGVRRRIPAEQHVLRSGWLARVPGVVERVRRKIAGEVLRVRRKVGGIVLRVHRKIPGRALSVRRRVPGRVGRSRGGSDSVEIAPITVQHVSNGHRVARA
eukprot:3616816-Rhodomonas_salina.1